ncbi:MAG: histidine kinase N-terminal 7TM domain-containing protein, partial [Candidatus Cryosericum sp.]
MQSGWYSSALIWVAGACVVLAYLGWRRRAVEGAFAFGVMMAGAALYALGSSFEISAASVPGVTDALRLEFIGIVTMPAAGIVCACQYAHITLRRLRWLPILLAVVPLLTLLAVWTNGTHHLFWPSISLMRAADGAMVLQKTYGPLFWAYLAYTYTLLMVSGGILIGYLARAGLLYEGQMAVMVTGIALGILGNLTYLLHLDALHGMDLGPVGFMAFGMAMIVDLYHFRARDIVALGRDALMENASDAVILLDGGERVAYLNRAASALASASQEQTVGKPVAEVLPELKEAVRLSATMGRREVEIAAGPATRSFDLVVQSLRQRSGTLAGYLLVLHETTAHKQEEERLRFAQLQWQQFLEASPDPMWIKDTEGRYVAANEAFKFVDPARYRDVVGRTDAECFPAEIAAAYVADDQKAIRDGVREGEFTAVGVDGKLRTFLTKKVALRTPDGAIAGTLGIAREITERKRAEDALRESEARFKTIFDESPLGIALTDSLTGKIQALNPIFAQILGRPVEELVGTDWMGLTHPEDIGKDLEQTALLVAGKIPRFQMDKRFIRPDGSIVWVSMTIASFPLPIQEGPVHLCMIEDITERMRAEAQLRQAQKMEAIGQLAGGVAHDFNNLLTGILGNMAIIRTDLPPEDALQENAAAVEEAARQAANLTKGLLTFGRNAVVLPVPMRMAAALDVSVAMLKQSLPATMQVVRDDQESDWTVLMDQSQVTQIVLNLAVNARDAMDGVGTLTIRTRNEVVDEAYLRDQPFARTGEFVRLTFTDTGPGILPEAMPHLFEPFYTTKPFGTGTGLGLSIVYGAVKQAGGWIVASSRNGPAGDHGATFDIYLPRCL